MRQKKIKFTLVIGIMLVSLVSMIAVPTSAVTFHSVYGIVYIGGNLAPSGTEVEITFDDGAESDIIDLDDGYYQIDWQSPNHEHEWPIPGRVGEIKVIIGSSEFTPDDNDTIKIYSDTTGYLVNLSLEILNNPPNAPSNPKPSNGANNVDNNKKLSWSCSDPDGDPLSYDVYFGNITSPPLVSSGQTAKSYDPPGAMVYGGTYYWQIVAHDDKGASTSGAEWSFSVETSEPPQPPPGPPGPPSNIAPNAVAKVDDPVGFVGQEFNFDGTDSSDPDGTITNYSWDFGDGSIGYGASITHVYSGTGEYIVTLTVTDDDGAKGYDTTSVVITVPNIPPGAPVISGPKMGTKNDTYKYTFVSIDDDNDSLSYNITWGDGLEDETEQFDSDEPAPANHSWKIAGAGIYTITAYADDDKAISGITEYVVLIDVWWVKDIGYIIDYDANGIYEKFFSNSTSEETETGMSDGKYLIDEDGDGKWDWIYEKEPDILTPYKEKEETEDDNTLCYILVLVIIILVILGYLALRKKNTPEPKKPAQKKTKK
jgi:chitodextrinase